MSINLDNYVSVQTNVFVRIQVDEYRKTSTDPYTQELLLFSDYSGNYDINGETYTALGNLLGVSASTAEIRNTEQTITLTLSGIPNDSIKEIVYSKIKGAPVDIYRAFFDVSSGTLIGSVYRRFKGYVNNYSLEEQYDIASRTASNTLIIECASGVEVLRNKVSGRKTNPTSQKRFYPGDTGMDRVPVIEETEFNFGSEI